MAEDIVKGLAADGIALARLLVDNLADMHVKATGERKMFLAQALKDIQGVQAALTTGGGWNGDLVTNIIPRIDRRLKNQLEAIDDKEFKDVQKTTINTMISGGLNMLLGIGKRVLGIG